MHVSVLYFLLGVSPTQSLDHGHHECPQPATCCTRPEGVLSLNVQSKTSHIAIELPYSYMYVYKVSCLVFLLQLNLKFEIEVLCKHIAVEIADIRPSKLLEDSERAKSFNQLSSPKGVHLQVHTFPCTLFLSLSLSFLPPSRPPPSLLRAISRCSRRLSPISSSAYLPI